MRGDDWLIRQLPVGMAEQHFLRRFLKIFQDVSDTVLTQVDVLDRVFDPAVAPDEMVRQMGRWIGLDWIDSSFEDETQRRAVMSYAGILPWRGTAKGLRDLLKLITDSDDVTVTDIGGGIFKRDGANDLPPHIRITMPASTWITDQDIVRIVRSEVPASVTFELEIDGRVVWPVSGGSAGELVNEEVT